MYIVESVENIDISSFCVVKTGKGYGINLREGQSLTYDCCLYVRNIIDTTRKVVTIKELWSLIQNDLIIGCMGNWKEHKEYVDVLIIRYSYYRLLNYIEFMGKDKNFKPYSFKASPSLLLLEGVDETGAFLTFDGLDDNVFLISFLFDLSNGNFDIVSNRYIKAINDTDFYLLKCINDVTQRCLTVTDGYRYRITDKNKFLAGLARVKLEEGANRR